MDIHLNPFPTQFHVNVKWNFKNELLFVFEESGTVEWRGQKANFTKENVTENSYTLKCSVFIPEQGSEHTEKKGLYETFELKIWNKPGEAVKHFTGVFQREGEGPLPCKGSTSLPLDIKCAVQ